MKTRNFILVIIFLISMLLVGIFCSCNNPTQAPTVPIKQPTILLYSLPFDSLYWNSEYEHNIGNIDLTNAHNLRIQFNYNNNGYMAHDYYSIYTDNCNIFYLIRNQGSFSVDTTINISNTTIGSQILKHKIYFGNCGIRNLKISKIN
jgi:hypothetical protein